MTKVLFDISISSVEHSLLKVMSDNICEAQRLRSIRRKSQQSLQTPRHSLAPYARTGVHAGQVWRAAR
jgi:hypothetical protein